MVRKVCFIMSVIGIIGSLGGIVWSFKNENGNALEKSDYVLGLSSLLMLISDSEVIVKLLSLPGIARGVYGFAWRHKK